MEKPNPTKSSCFKAFPETRPDPFIAFVMPFAVTDFDFSIPPELIAKHPPAQRDGARLLQLLVQGGLSDRNITDLPQLVQPGDLWLINDTRVIPSRLFGHKASGGKVELLLLEALDDHQRRWRAWGKSNRPCKLGEQISIAEGVVAEVVARDGRELELELACEDVASALAQHGHMPLPPYIDRPDDIADRTRYQTVFATVPGAVAAPTAGLHLTGNLMAAMEHAGAQFARITLHVGPGTFQPVSVDRIGDHAMHAEHYTIPEATARSITLAKAEGRRVVCVGTTSLRAIESAWQDGEVRVGAFTSRLFIYPGYHWRVADVLLTNFHLPRSTLLMLVAAMTGRERVLAAYRHAVAAHYRFFSYGDAMFVERDR
ncbi:MAG: tRNA preQ1(34) S-adenosylmethionine ribosyltransferase-isomerase QueA [Mariprofundales bacterium]|nr:tRNA preQ1(34) S-adenosylmethionine ribosyltransferase-isomerase QueA [Mariprofundales bacterium]